MKSDDESKQLKNYYIVLLICFMFLIISFSILAIPKRTATINNYNFLNTLSSDNKNVKTINILISYEK